MLKAKWKGLRDTFRAELKKEQVYQKSKFHRNRPVWIHFKSLQFLKEQMVPRPPIWERVPRTENERTSESEGEAQNGKQTLEDDIVMDHVLVGKGENSLPKSELGNGHHHRRNGHHHSNDQVEVKQEPDENFENLEFHSASENQMSSDNEMMMQNISPEQVLMSDGESNVGMGIDPLEGSRYDDNYFFLMSLLPHIKALPADRKILLRMQMLELVYKEVYKKNEETTPASAPASASSWRLGWGPSWTFL